MPLDFQPRADGYRVCYMTSAGERMLASVKTKAITGYTPIVCDPNGKPIGGGEAIYALLPRDECMIHSAVGALSITDLEEIISGLPVIGEKAVADTIADLDSGRSISRQFAAASWD